MLWRLECTGTIEGVRAYVRDAEPSLDTARVPFERARAFVLAELARVRTNGVTVDAEGGPDTTRIVVTDLSLELTATRPETPATAALPTLAAEPANAALQFAKESVTAIGPHGGAAVRPARRHTVHPLGH
jgi:hypothetical protein